MPLHAFGGDLDARSSSVVTPLSDQAFSVRAGEMTAAPHAAAKAAPVPSRLKAIRASANVFTYRAKPLQVEPPHGLAAESVADATALMRSSETNKADAKVRQDLLAGMPDDVAGMIVQAAREEGVDPNLMLSIARAENGAFDATAVSGAGAVGIMQMLPETGAAYGASDLTDPAQNVRASAKFLKVLVDKYANPMLVAAAYNAGEPKVDVRRSLPLIRETANYVTRVVGLYTHAYAPGDIETVGRVHQEYRSNEQRGVVRTKVSSPARSTMLVFSISSAGPNTTDEAEQIQPSDGPVKVREEGSR
ncbi:lytic transglycosylase domain-containing protein [Mesorhizobium denitrificans]|nr:transglycosylase SLT domain-containing protein [Mesorhizobium denitrificans]